jgi:hypothetical protein
MKDIRALIYSIELRDPYTKGHSQRVALYARDFMVYINAKDKDTTDVYTAGLLHDIGKIAIPDSVLLKPCLLNQKEYEIIKYHPVLSESLIKKMENYKEIAKTVRHHHENYDGSGYPDRLKGDEIPYLSRVLSLADVFDALSTERIYRKAFSLEESIAVMEDMKYKFDPDLFKNFIKFIGQYGILKDNSFHMEKSEECKIKTIREEVFFTDVFTGLLNKNALLLLLRRCIEQKLPISIIKLELVNMKHFLKVKDIAYVDRIIKLAAAEIKNIISIKLSVSEPEKGDVYAFRKSGGIFLFMSVGEEKELVKSIEKTVEKVCLLNKGISFEYETVFSGRKPDYNFEKQLEYLV